MYIIQTDSIFPMSGHDVSCAVRVTNLTALQEALALYAYALSFPASLTFAYTFG